jgi:LPPG:FO 2-phospho-L-lactate transferase
VAEHYGDLLDGFVIDTADAELAGAIEELGTAVLTTHTVMHTLDDRIGLAREVLQFAARLAGDV